MMGRLSTWLVVGLTAAAFAAGLAGRALLDNGSQDHHTASVPSQTITAPAASPSHGPPAPVKPLRPKRAHRREVHSAPQTHAVRVVVRHVPQPGGRVIVQVPETNPMAAAPPPEPAGGEASAAAPSTPAPGASAPATPSGAEPGDSGEPAELDPAARRVVASEAAALVKSASEAVGGEAGGAGEVLSQLERCLELVADSSLPAGVEPSACQLG
jgi:hypothetical protein